MSLLRLLTAGRSLVGMNQSGSRYQVSNRGLLPKFGSDRNPFHSADAHVGCALPAEPARRETQPSLLPAQTQPLESLGGAQQSEVPQSTPVVHSDTNPVAQTSKSAVSPASKSAALSPAQAQAAQQPSINPAKPSGRLARWTQTITARLLGKRPRLAKPALPNFAKAPVQCELSLDRVKVVRNDLSDADLEVVPAKPAATVRIPETAKRPQHRPQEAGAPASQKAAPVELTGVARGPLSLRQFGAGKL